MTAPPLKEVTVQIAALAVSAERDAVLATYALGSCIAVVLHDPVRKVGGMIHYMLPSSATSPQKAAERPAMFANTGVPMLFEEMYAHGCTKKDLVVKVVGGSQLCDPSGHFDIGARNYTVLRQMLWKAGCLIKAAEVGGSQSRTVRLEVETGAVRIYSAGEERTL